VEPLKRPEHSAIVAQLDDKVKGLYPGFNSYMSFEGQGREPVPSWLEDKSDVVITGPGGELYKGSLVDISLLRAAGIIKTAKNGDVPGGKIRLIFGPRGERFYGNWMDWKLEGEGTGYYPDGSIYEGEFHNFRREGKGVCSYADGRVYKGSWRNDLRDGEGTMTDAKGKKITGPWKDGVLNKR
jgi:hypothetical protein